MVLKFLRRKESGLNRALRESKERDQKFKRECIGQVPGFLRRLKQGLMKLEKTSDREILWNIGNEIDMDSRMVCFYAIMGANSEDRPRVKDYYEKTIQMLQRVSETLRRYSNLDLFSEFSVARRDALIKTSIEYQLI